MRINPEHVQGLFSNFEHHSLLFQTSKFIKMNFVHSCLDKKYVHFAYKMCFEGFGKVPRVYS